jgi:hypothetical protein
MKRRPKKTQKINKTDTSLLEKINKIDKSLVRLRKEENSNKTRDEKEDMVTNNTERQRIIDYE